MRFIIILMIYFILNKYITRYILLFKLSQQSKYELGSIYDYILNENSSYTRLGY
jgi:hypothetical protein